MFHMFEGGGMSTHGDLCDEHSCRIFGLASSPASTTVVVARSSKR